MRREILDDLAIWHADKHRKPLVIRGARQVGKTWVVRELAGRVGADLVELNFELRPELADVFRERSPARILQEVERLTGRRVRGSNTLLFFDEVQKAPEAFASLRWFYEERPELAVVATGSLLDFVLPESAFSVPVGRVSHMFLEPMSFGEFLRGSSEEPLADILEELGVTSELSDVVHSKLQRLFRTYVTVGGMPAVVAQWIDSQSPPALAQLQQDIINTYADDFAKYAARIPPQRLRKTMLSVPRSLGQKYKYSHVGRQEKSKAIKAALKLLCLARLCHKVTSSQGHRVPLAAEENDRAFKVVFVDVGLASAIQGIVLTSDTELEELIRVNRGGISEQVVAQMLRASNFRYVDPVLHYYSREKKGSEAEIDYLLQHDSKVVPVEVKAGTAGTLKSLHQFMAERDFELAVRVNADKPSVVNVDTKTTTGATAKYTLLSIPFYLAGQMRRLV